MRRINDELKAQKTGLERYGAALDKAGDQALNFGKAMSLGVTLPMIAAGKVAFDEASKLQESMSKTEVVFGENAKAVKEWSKTASTAMGQSSQQALEAASTYGNLFQAFGVGRKESTKMSTELTQLASDLASFNNTSVDEAIEALRSGLSGETEPLKRYGIAINDARLKSEAFRLGLLKGNVDKTKVEAANLKIERSQIAYNKAVKEHGKNSLQARTASNGLKKANEDLEKATSGLTDTLSPGVKAQAAFALIMKDSTLAQGDFQRTSDGAANKLRIMQAQLKDTASSLGEALIPIVTEAAGQISKFASKFSNLTDEQKKLIVKVGLLAAAIGPLVTVIGAMAKAIAATAKATQTLINVSKSGYNAFKYFRESWPWIRKYPKAFAALKTEQTKATAATVRATVASKAQLVITKAQIALTKVWTAAQAAFNAVMALNPFILIIAGVAALVAALVLLYKKNEAFRNFVQKAWAAITKVFTAAFNAIKGAFLQIGEWIGRYWRVIITLILGPVGLLIVALVRWRAGVATIFKQVWKIIKMQWDAIAAVIMWVWNNVIQPIWAAIVWYIKNILIPNAQRLWAIIKTVFSAIGAVISWAWNNIIKPAWAAITWYISNVLIPGFQLVWNVISDVFGKIGSKIKDVWNNIIKPTMDALVGVWDTLKNAMGGAWDWINEHVVAKIKKVTGFMDGFLQKTTGVVNKVKDFFGLSSGEKVNLGLEKVINAAAVTSSKYHGPPKKEEKRALGGRIFAGVPFKAGEGGGPEWIMPTVSGHVVNARDSKKMGNTYHVTVNAAKADMDERDLITILKRVESLYAA